jgi:hypothetical protein
MPTEDHSSDRSHQGLPQGGGDLSLDELAKGLATGTLSRGKALRLMGAALVGGALASIPGIAMAKPRPAGSKCNHNHQCASGNCEGGTCAAACVPIAGTCSANNQCCSGRCAGGTCAEPCSSDRVLLSNGTCAKPCTSGVDCPPCSVRCDLASSLDVSYCTTGNATPLQGCPNGDIDCPEGQFCRFGLGDPDLCAVAC